MHTDTPRDSVTRALAAYYRELSPPEQEKPFSITRFLDRMSQGPKLTGEEPEHEREVIDAHALSRGLDRDPRRPIIPWRAFRALSDSTGPGGGYLVGGAGPHNELALLLSPYSIVAEAGVSLIDAEGTGAVALPVHNTAPSGAWLGPGVTINASTAPLGSLSMTPKTHITVLDYSVQLDRQAGPLTDRLVSTALLQTAGAAMDTAVFTGTGGAQPLGITSRSDITAQSGTTLSWAGVCAMRKTVLNSGAREASLRWIGAPDAQEILMKREKTTALGCIWADGMIGGIPAVATSRMPAGYLVLADWSQLYVAIWNGGLQVQINPHAGYNTATQAARVIAMLDVGFAQAGAVTYAKSIT